MMTVKHAFKQSVPIMAGYIVLGMGFGVLLESKGYGVLWAIAMSVFIYAGSMQYVAINLITGGASLIATALMTLMVNARHLFYGISMLDKYKNTGKYKPYLIFALTDETYSLVCSGKIPEGVDRNKYYFLVSLFDQVYWLIGSVIGSVVGSVLNFNTAGIDFSMTALFLVVFVEQWKSTKDHASAIAGVAASVVCLLIFGAGNFVIPAMISITVILLLMRKFRKGSEEAAGKGEVEHV
jgi:4-azaleucine resistance transporter AzlC